MDPPPPPAAPLSAPPPPHHPLTYADSVDSSPRSRTAEPWDDPLPSAAGAGGGRLRLMCSYGGHIVPRPHDKSLCYVGGETRIVVADRNSPLADLSAKLSKTLLGGRAFTLKYQLPSEDLDSLISVTTDEDLDNMIDEYDRTAAPGGGGSAAARPSRLRLFLFAAKPESSQSIGPILDSSAKSDDWFLNALNGATAGLINRGFSDSASVNCLLGLDDDVGIGGGGGSGNGANSNSNSSNLDPVVMEPLQKNSVKQGNSFQDFQSVPDSPMLETTSSFGSTSSSPSLSNLPPIRVHVEDGGGAIRGVHDQKVGLIEEQFAQLNIAASAGGFNKQDESGGFGALSSPPPMSMPSAIVPSSSSSSLTVPANRVMSDDERSDHGGMFRKQQPLQKPSNALDLPSPDSVSSDSSFGNALSRPKAVLYHHQDPIVQNQRVSQPIVVDSKLNTISDPNSGYVLQQQQQQQAQSQAQQQFVHHGAHYMNQHHPMSAAYFPVYTSQPQHHPHQLDQQFPVYYVPARQPQQPYNNNNNITVQQQLQSNMSDASIGIMPTSQPQPHLNPGMVHLPNSTASGYNQVRTVQVPSGQQYVSYSHIHHHPTSQSLAPNAAANYGYEFADPNHTQIYFTQPLAPPPMGSQYQTMKEGSGQLPAETVKQQQMRT